MRRGTLACATLAAALPACITVIAPTQHHVRRAEAAPESTAPRTTVGTDLGGGAAEGHSTRGESRDGVPVRPSVEESRAALARAYAWLAGAQKQDGSWAHDLKGPPSRAIGTTALAVLALLESDAHAEAARRGAAWLLAQQDADSGLIGPQAGKDFLYGHGIATLALVEAGGAADRAPDRHRVQAAVDLILRARNPHAAWRYDLPPIGDNDTSVTGWMLAALDAARERGYAVDETALRGGMDWIDEVTDPATGRVGYDSFGSLSSRTQANEAFPRDRGEAMTAVGLASRVEVQEEEAASGLVRSHARLLKRKLPEWDADGLGVDMYYWYHGTRAMRSVGGADWQAWRAALCAAAVPNQAEDGSWDPVDAWGYAGGRTYATALMALSIAACVED